MFKMFLPAFKFSWLGRECRIGRDSFLQRFLCWLLGCCPQEAGKGKSQ